MFEPVPSPLLDEIPPPVPVIFVRSSWPPNYDVDAASLASATHPGGASLTQQQFRDEVDINFIVRQFGLTGQLPENGLYPVYGSFDDVVDYHTAANLIRASEEAFMALPGEVRLRFNNDPQLLLEFCSDPANLAEAHKLGLARPIPPAAAKVETPPAPPAPASTNT